MLKNRCDQRQEIACRKVNIFGRRLFSKDILRRLGTKLQYNCSLYIFAEDRQTTYNHIYYVF